MSLRAQIREVMYDPATNLGHDGRIDRIMRLVDEEITRSATVHLDGARQYADLVLERRRGAEQGISRLALIGFIAGDPGLWSGERRSNGHRSAWVRYRGHQIAREENPDGLLIAVGYTDHQQISREARLTVRHQTELREPALTAAARIDDLLDAVIEENGLPDDEPIVAAEVVENIDGETARRVFRSYHQWMTTVPVQRMTVDEFAAAIDRGEVEP